MTGQIAKVIPAGGLPVYLALKQGFSERRVKHTTPAPHHQVASCIHWHQTDADKIWAGLSAAPFFRECAALCRSGFPDAHTQSNNHQRRAGQSRVIEKIAYDAERIRRILRGHCCGRISASPITGYMERQRQPELRGQMIGALQRDADIFQHAKMREDGADMK